MPLCVNKIWCTVKTPLQFITEKSHIKYNMSSDVAFKISVESTETEESVEALHLKCVTMEAHKNSSLLDLLECRPVFAYAGSCISICRSDNKSSLTFFLIQIKLVA